MTIDEVYKSILADYDEVLHRLKKPERILRFIKAFPEEKTMEKLEKAIEAHDCEEAFLAVHNMKGISLNLGFSNLSKYCEALTEELRDKDELPKKEVLAPLVDALKKEYEKAVEIIKKLD